MFISRLKFIFKNPVNGSRYIIAFRSVSLLPRLIHVISRVVTDQSSRFLSARINCVILSTRSQNLFCFQFPWINFRGILEVLGKCVPSLVKFEVLPIKRMMRTVKVIIMIIISSITPIFYIYVCAYCESFFMNSLYTISNAQQVHIRTK